MAALVVVELNPPQARVLERVPLAPGAKDEEDGIHDPASIDSWLMAPQWVRLPRWEQRLDALPEVVGDRPITPNIVWLVTHGAGSSDREISRHTIPKIEPIGIGS